MTAGHGDISVQGFVIAQKSVCTLLSIYYLLKDFIDEKRDEKMYKKV